MTPPEIALPPRPRGLRFPVEALAAPRLDVRAEDRPTISIFDAIRTAETLPRVTAALRQIGPRPVLVEINSPGGDAFEGAGVFNALVRHGHPVTVQILGIAASAASLVAMAGSTIQIARNAQIMIHDAAGMVVGSASEMRAFADTLDKIDASMAATYARRSGLPVAEVRRLMAEETFMSADRAIQLGFADSLMDREADPRPAALARTAPGTLRDLEAALRDAGLSRAQASRVAAHGWVGMSGEPDIDADAVAARLHRNAQLIAKMRSQ